MPRDKKAAAVRQYRKLCEDYYILCHEYRNEKKNYAQLTMLSIKNCLDMKRN